jgi:hypothetical protein
MPILVSDDNGLFIMCSYLHDYFNLEDIVAKDQPQDEWHDADGKPQGTPERVRAFVEGAVPILNTIGSQLASLAHQVDYTTTNDDYLSFMRTVFVRPTAAPLSPYANCYIGHPFAF